MGYPLPVEVYEAIRGAIGDEESVRRVVAAISGTLEEIERKAKEQKVVVKAELRDELRSELATKKDLDVVRYELKGEIETVRKELKGEIEAVRKELKGEIEAVRKELKGEIRALDEKIERVRQELKGEIRELRAYLKFIVIFMIIGFTLFNPQFYKMVELLVGLIK